MAFDSLVIASLEDAQRTAGQDIFDEPVKVPGDGVLVIQFLASVSGIITAIVVRKGKTLTGTLDKGTPIGASQWGGYEFPARSGDTLQFRFGAIATISVMLSFQNKT